MLHESIIGLVYDKAEKKNNDFKVSLGQTDVPREAKLKHFEANILRYAVMNLLIIVESLRKKKYSTILAEKDWSRSFKLCLNLTKILGLSDDLL